MGIEQIAILVALILSIVLHEMSHGYAANWLGDPTARLAGRLSGNPFVHLDPLGSVIIPALLFFSPAGFIFGWAKPVPYNPYNLRDQKWGEAIVAAAGPLTNIALAIIFAILVRVGDVFNFSSSFIELSIVVVYINILLALFNLIPIPPLDGSKILKSVLPFELSMKYQSFTMWMERFGLFATFAFIFLFMQIAWPYFSYAVKLFVSLLAGLPFEGM